MPVETAPLDEKLASAPVSDLRRVEIFRVGDYGPKGAYTEADLDELVATVGIGGHQAPLTLDHAQEGPAYGWLTKAYRVGKSLFADFSGVPEALIGAIKNRRYIKRSIEIYSDFSGLGKKAIRAVTLLGASVPEVKGMADITLSEGGGFLSFTFEEGGVTDIQASPFPASHGVITQEIPSGTVLGHRHVCYLDGEGSGFTSPPLNMYGEPGATGHVHEIVRGIFQPSGDIAHIHDLAGSYVQTLSERSAGDTEVKTMSEKSPKVPDAAPATPAADAPIVDIKRFEEVTAENSALKATIENMKAETAKAERAAKFSEAFDKALAEGRVTPGEREGQSKIYDALPEETAKTFLETLATRPKVITLSETTEPRAAVAVHEVGPSDPAAKRAAEHTAIKKFQEENKIGDFQEAALAFFRKAPRA